MNFTVLLFGFALQNLSLVEYKNHYETSHVPLAKTYAQSSWPLSHTRYYYDDKTVDNWDSLAVLEFRDADHAISFNTILSQPDAAHAIHSDEAKFMKGQPQMIIIGTNSAVTVP
ncbi:hypothetical protein BDV95DRAFT_608209 [Massariosphaeria phaeospora]|uniref:EthD domain-containing protein n=1 Tax=Massariosphaeria phaeospora TaxID=100035 RepID=A0A7C8MIF2_9PLEO|nr:hypothetical protein BDV95DRAFT_608209 [Massariosphaeria phaeospora]